MSRLRVTTLGLLALAAGLFVSSAGQAQIKVLPWDPEDEKETIKGVSFVEIENPADYQHGALVSLTLKNNNRLTGTLVRTDRAQKKLFIRTRPGELPTAVSVDEVAKIQKGVREERRKKDGVGFATLSRQPVIEPEITSVTIHHGAEETTTSFTARSLSPQEKAVLTRIEAAENEMAHVSNLMALRTTYMSQERDMQNRRNEAITQVFEGAAAQARQVSHNAPLFLSQNGYVGLFNPMYGPASGFGTTPLGPTGIDDGLGAVTVFGGGLNRRLGFGGRLGVPGLGFTVGNRLGDGVANFGPAGYGPAGLGLAGLGWGGWGGTMYTAGPATLPTSLPEVPPIPPAAQAAIKELTPDYVAKVRQNLTEARAAAVYEDGRIVAVVVDGNQRGGVVPAADTGKGDKK